MSRGPWLTAAFKAEVWRHWQSGETCAEISRALDKTCGVIHGVVAERGGVAPVARCRKRCPQKVPDLFFQAKRENKSGTFSAQPAAQLADSRERGGADSG